MRISVLGNSDTTGMLLAPGARVWPALLEERLRESVSEPVVVDSWRFAPYRPGAVRHALDLVKNAQPDVVVLTLASYWCAFGTVRASVEQRFGRRAAMLYSRGEHAYSRHVEGDVQPGKPGRMIGRRLARRLAGTGTVMSFPQFIDVYASLIRELSQQEQLQVVVLGDHHYTPYIHRMIPSLAGAIVGIEHAIRPLVAERELCWGDLEQAISAGGRREEMILSDGVHMTEEAHERVARALLPVFEAFGPRT